MLFGVTSALIGTRILGRGNFGTYAAALSIHQYAASIGQARIWSFLLFEGADDVSETDVWTASSFLGCVVARLRVGGAKGMGFASSHFHCPSN
jgi:hypothetical protein